MKKKSQHKIRNTKFNKLEKELALKKRELKIEASLEKVRHKTMRMKKPSDMLIVCKTISLRLEILGIREIRNVQTAIFYPGRGTYMNYEYYAKHFKTIITETVYTNHKMHKEFAQKMLKGRGEFFVTHIKGKKVKDWIAYQKTTNVFIDKYLETASSVNYYWFSLGPVALGISTYKPLCEEEIKLFKRFLKVFELAYMRYLDIELAETQVREAKIEAALEKVRAVAMGMKKPEDILNVGKVLFIELKRLGFDDIRNILVSLFNDDGQFFMDYDYSDFLDGSITKIFYDSHPVIKNFIAKMRKANEAFAEIILDSKQMKGLEELRKKIGKPHDPRLKNLNVLYYYNYSIGSGTIGISNFKSITEEQREILKRFGNVFNLTYRRYNDIALAEAQAREAKIEAALEKVRASAMSMHKSEDLLEVCEILFRELTKLGFDEIRNAMINIHNDDNKNFLNYDYSNEIGKSVTLLDYNAHPVMEKQIKQSRIANDAFSQAVYKGKDLEAWKEFRKKYGEKDDPRIKDTTALFYYFYSIGTGTIGISTFNPIGEEKLSLLKRFRNVFSLAYQRYSDIALAEAHAREAQIEAALERVRSRTMAMQKSEELKEVIQLVYDQFIHLNIHIEHTGFVVDYTPKGDWHFWIADKHEVPSKITHTYFNSVWANQFNKAKEEGVDFFTTNLNFEEKNKFYKDLLKLIPGVPEETLEFYLSCPGLAATTVLMDNVGLYIENFSGIPYSDEENAILLRFGKVFQQTYTRFLDLQKAEAQARESQIEAALERVRAKAMAMHSSNDLSDTMGVLFIELPKLSISSLRCGVVLLSKNSTTGVFYAAATTQESDSFTMIGAGDMKKHPVFMRQYDSWLRKENYFVSLSGEDLHSYYKEIFARLSKTYSPREHKIQTEHGYYFSFSEGMFYAWSEEPYSEESINILNRFKAIIDLTFRRYLDLQKAEAQVREATIEASLERVRSRAMSMHNPDDLSETVSLFFKELKSLNVLPWRCGVGRIDEETRTTYLTTTSITKEGEIKEVSGKLKQTGHPVLDEIFEHWKMQKEYFPVLRDDEINKYYSVIKPQIAYPDYPLDAVQYGHNIPFKEGFIFAWTENKLSEDELQIFRRFSSVLSLTYRRYMDLKEAELRAQQSIKQASLDRVRAEIASMRTSEDLNRITPVIWRELKTLGVPFFRCGIYIIDEETESVHVYLTTPDGKSLGVLNMSFDSNEITSNTVNHWRKKLVYKEHWNKQEFNNWTKYLVEQNQIPTAQSYQGSSEAPETLDLHFVPFAQGMLYVGDVNPLKDDKLDLVKTLAEAFSIAYARYEDFKNLEDAKNKIEITLSELKSAQAQLVHSEKMASLGELTAGIAHEIKNPLNFVNNFSEISRELLDEMKTEIQNKNIDEVIELIEDLKQNLEKINQHGKRADSIVKGMLLHSRGTSGEKTPTDINDLLDQYVNLAYHGMRATNKEFNITIEKDYDETLEKINVVPQDLSRVFLNIINNGYYAAYEKRKIAGDNFIPVLKVSTENLNGKIEIIIGDNGNGMPADILDKIFQPFFTTKPTGEGTGLGLSLSYDIVTKVHGGELKVETKEGEGSVFIISIPKS
jgi:signal transduction histidine kinase